MKLQKTVFGLAIASILFTGSALAETNSFGGYISAGGGVADNETGKEMAFDLGTGVRVNEYVSYGLNYYDFGSSDETRGNVPSGVNIDWTGTNPQPVDQSVRTKLDVSGYGANVTGHLPLTDNFRLSGTLGVARLDVDSEVRVGTAKASDSAHSTSPLVGVSAAYSMTDSLMLEAGYTRLMNVGDSDSLSGEFDIDYASAGLRYAF